MSGDSTGPLSLTPPADRQDSRARPGSDSLLEPEAPATLPEATRRAIYDVMALRRDIRHFDSKRDVDEAVLSRILEAAHLAPSVGFSQPWHFIVIRDRAIRRRVRDSFLACRAAEAARFPADRRADYLAHKLEGIDEAPINLCVAVDLRDRDEAILGTTVQPEAVRASACCAVQNLWLAARAEGIGVGWVSIVEPSVLRSELALPAGIEPIAYLCIGHPLAFRRRPMLDETGWAARRPLAETRHLDRFREEPAAQRSTQKVVVTNNDISDMPREPALPPFDEAAAATARAHQGTLVKPHGSLGRLEELAVWYAGARGTFPVPLPVPALAVFAADHGVTTMGVSAYGSQATAAMVGAMMAGGAAVNVLAAQHDVQLTLVDVGVAGDLSALPREPLLPLHRRPVRAGTRNLQIEDAMTSDEVTAARRVGAETAQNLVQSGATLLGIGEVGIGNTTSAAAIIAALTGTDPAEVAGRGTGVDDETLQRKTAVIRQALARASHRDPLRILESLGGLEIAAMVGFLSAAARLRTPVVLDGFVTNAAALVACRLEPALCDYLLASHRSAERGAEAALESLAKEPLFALGLRLGEGTGAVLAMALVRTAVAAQISMATFATAGIPDRRR